MGAVGRIPEARFALTARRENARETQERIMGRLGSPGAHRQAIGKQLLLRARFGSSSLRGVIEGGSGIEEVWKRRRSDSAEESRPSELAGIQENV